MDKKGFLLFEVIISILIITVGLLYVTRSYSSSMNSLKRSQEMIESALLLEEKMWEFEEKGRIKEGEETGDFLSNKDYSWRVNANPIEDLGFNLVTLEVFLKKDPENVKYSISTYLKNET